MLLWALPPNSELGVFLTHCKSYPFFIIFFNHIFDFWCSYQVWFTRFAFFHLRNIAKEKELRTPDFLFIASITINKEIHSLFFLWIGPACPCLYLLSLAFDYFHDCYLLITSNLFKMILTHCHANSKVFLSGLFIFQFNNLGPLKP